MIEVKIPKEIKTYKEKLFFKLNLRQTICTIIAIAINVPLYYFGRQYIQDDVLSWIVIGIATPIMLIGYFRYNGMTFGKFIVVIFLNGFLYPQNRLYKTENFYEVMSRFSRKGR